jgi:hypothetical protein
MSAQISRALGTMVTDASTMLGSVVNRSLENIGSINPKVKLDTLTKLGDVESVIANASQVTGHMDKAFGALDVPNRKLVLGALTDPTNPRSQQIMSNFENTFEPNTFKPYGYNNFQEAYSDLVHAKPRQFMDPEGRLEAEYGVSPTNEGFLPRFKQLVGDDTPSVDKFDELVNYGGVTSKLKNASKKAYDFESIDPKKIEEYSLGESILKNLTKVGYKHHIGGLEPVAMGIKGGIEYEAKDGGLLNTLTQAYNKAGTQVERDNIKQIANIAMTGYAQRDVASKALAKFHGAILTNNIGTMLKTFPDIFRANVGMPTLLKNISRAMVTPTGSNNAIGYLNTYLRHNTSKGFYSDMKIPDIVQSVETRMRSANVLSVIEEDMIKNAQNNPALLTQIQAKGGIDPFLDEFLNNTKFQKSISDMLPKGSKFNDLLLKGIQSVRETQGAITPFDYRPIAHSGVGQTAFAFRDAEMQTAGRIGHLLKKTIGNPNRETVGELTRYLRPYMLTAITTGGSLPAILGQQTFENLVTTLNNTGHPEIAQSLLTFQENTQTPLRSFAESIDATKFLPNISSPISAFLPTESSPMADFFGAMYKTSTGEMTDQDLQAIMRGSIAGLNAAIPAGGLLSGIKAGLAPLPLSRAVSEGTKALGINPQSIDKGVYKDKTGIHEQAFGGDIIGKVLINADPERRRQSDIELRLETAKKSISELYDSGVDADQILDADPELAGVLQELFIAKGVTDPDENENEIAKLIRNSTVDQELRQVGELVSAVFEDGEVTQDEEKTFAVLQKLANTVDWESTKYGSFEQFVQDRMPQQ